MDIPNKKLLENVYCRYRFSSHIFSEQQWYLIGRHYRCVLYHVADIKSLFEVLSHA